MDVSYKTVFVLDHGPYFAAKCVQPVEVGAASKFEDSKISKSLWTCCVEVALEYRRIMSDLFQRDTKFIRFVLSDSIGRFLTPDWGEDSNRLENIWFNIFEAGQPDPSVEENCSIINGLSLAVEALIQSTKIQIEQKKNGVPVQNCGRIVVVTHLESSENMIDIHRHVGGLIGSHNKLANYLGDSFSPLNEVEMCFVNIRNEDSKSNNGSEFWKNESRKTMISSILKSEFIELYGGDDLNSAFYSLIQRHFDLTSTTISGVPMKEEKCLSSQSANYDIELLHPRDVHKNLAKRLCQGSARKQLLTNKNGYVSVLLRWNSSTTKIGSNSRFVSCGAYPITPVDVNSRPSTCLTNFVLTGRTVLLEIPNVGDKDGTKCISHILTNHHGRIYMHSLPVSENVMGKIPSLFELPITNPFNNALHQQRIERPPPLMRLELPLSVPTVVAQPPPHLPRTAAAASPAHAAKPPDLTRQQLLDALKQARSSSGAVVTGLPTVDRHGKPIKNMISYLKNQLQKKRRVLHVSPDAKKARTPAMLRVIESTPETGTANEPAAGRSPSSPQTQSC